jgi:hypothetical protein
LYRLNYGAFAPLLMAIFSRDEYDDREVCNLLSLMERYICLIFRVSQRRANTGDSEFYSFARKYYKKEISILDIIGIRDLENNEYSGINWWVKKYIDLKSFKVYLDDKFKNRDGYYSWNGLAYFLYEYELYLKNNSKNKTNKINWDSYSESKADYKSIEHILPQTITEECWNHEFDSYSEQELKFICNSLGNLLPLSVPKNSKLQNYCFDVKKGGKDGEFTGYKNGSYSEQQVNEKNNWRMEEIHERGLVLLEFLVEHWNIKDYLIEQEVNEEFLFLPYNK